MGQLPIVARLYVGAVIFAGLSLLVACLPGVHFDQPLVFAILLVFSSATAAMKVHLPLTTSGSTL